MEQPKTQVFKIADLNPAKYNPRKALQPGDPEFAALCRSIETFGYVDLVVVNKTEYANAKSTAADAVATFTTAEDVADDEGITATGETTGWTYTYESSDTNVVAVSGSTLKWVANGTATITGTATKGKYTATVTITGKNITTENGTGEKHKFTCA